MSGKILSAISIVLLLQGFLLAQTSQPPVYNDADAYEVYSAVLSLPENLPSAKSKSFVIRRETLRNFGALIDNETTAQTQTCLRPDSESAKIIGTAIDNYIKINQTKWRLQEKLKIETSYKLVDSKTIVSIINPLTKKEDWKAFYKQFPDSGGFIDLSAVGFNTDKSVAVVSKGQWCGKLCGEGNYYILQKKEGKWIPLKWNGEACNWVS